MMGVDRFVVKLCALMSVVLMSMQVVLVVVSWVLTVLWPSLPVRSLLGSDGIRWLFGSVESNMVSPVLLWLLLLGCVAGVLRRSRLLAALVAFRRITDYERMALMVVGWEVVAMVLVVVALALVPHAILLSALGTIVPSSFSSGVVPFVATSACAAALTYGKITGSLRSLADAFGSLVAGIAGVAPAVIVYFFAAELYHSVIWAFVLR